MQSCQHSRARRSPTTTCRCASPLQTQSGAAPVCQECGGGGPAQARCIAGREKEERRRLAKQKRQRTAAADDGDGSRQARKNHNAWKERMRLQGVAYTGGYDAAGLPHGNGKMTFKDGDTYEGEYMNGERHGQGTLKTLLLLLIMYITNHDIIYNVHVR